MNHSTERALIFSFQETLIHVSGLCGVRAKSGQAYPVAEPPDLGLPLRLELACAESLLDELPGDPTDPMYGRVVAVVMNGALRGQHPAFAALQRRLLHPLSGGRQSLVRRCSSTMCPA